jgi:hypothetical protein
MKGVFPLLAAGTLLCLLTNGALAYDNSTNSEAARQHHSLLSIWDKPAFSPARREVIASIRLKRCGL